MNQSISSPQSADHRRTLGAVVVSGGVEFRVWAPKRQRVVVVCAKGDAPDLVLQRDAAGYFTGTCPHRKAGDRYFFLLDEETYRYPDPASRFQPDGPHGPSEIVDPSRFRWTDADWKGLDPADNVLYEMHIGTFTPEGNWGAATDKLPLLKELGVTCLEIMPLSEVRGTHNWGYDGVGRFAPTRNYGTPDDLRRFIDRAHALGIAVILDVVYNHLGPDGNYLPAFTDTIFSDKHKTDWGEAINFDGEGSAGVRQFFIASAVQWIRDYHFDGFRFDATQNIYDDSKPHILAEISDAVRATAKGRRLYLVAENEPQDTNIARPTAKGGFGFDALWNDDWHHSAMVALTGRSEAYYSDYEGRPQEFISAAKWGYLFQGQFYHWQKKRRGGRAYDLAPWAFVTYLQNHDQIANYGRGHRVHYLASPTLLRAMTVLQLLGPQSPLLFQGQEWGASSDFNYFSDMSQELHDSIKQGRKNELSQFVSIKDPALIATLPDPSAMDTFTQSKLDWSERLKPHHREALAFHTELLRVRREDPVLKLAQRERRVDGAVLSHNAFIIRFFGTHDDDRLLVVNLGADLHKTVAPEPLLAPPTGFRWKTLISSEEPRFGGHGVAELESRGEDWRQEYDNWRIPGHSATLLCTEIDPDENRLQIK
ncbi:MAG: malto-oligosyltrehalose trehalohydrolase [Tepidisphaeraceae bacterium]